MPTIDERIQAFFAAGPWAVAGASTDRRKYGNKVLRAYLQNGKQPVYPVNPHATEVEGLTAYPDVASCPEPVRAMSIITQPNVTEKLVEEAAAAGVEHLWIQPGAEEPGGRRSSAGARDLGHPRRSVRSRRARLPRRVDE